MNSTVVRRRAHHALSRQPPCSAPPAAPAPRAPTIPSVRRARRARADTRVALGLDIDMDADALLGVVPFATAWAASVGLSRLISPLLFTTYRNHLSKPEQSYWACSLTSTIHAAVVVYLAAAALLRSPGFYSSWGGGGEDGPDIHFTTPASRQCFQVFLGYLLSDATFVLWYRREWVGT